MLATLESVFIEKPKNEFYVLRVYTMIAGNS